MIDDHQSSEQLLSIVVPIYNEEETLPVLWQRLSDVIQAWKYKTEVIFVNDGSVDGSYLVLKELYRQHPETIRIVKLSRNFGHQPAVIAGLTYASGKAVILMDGDLQDTPEELPRLVEKWESGFDVVYAVRTKRKEFFIKRWAFSLFYKLQSKLVNLSIPLDAGLFSIIDKQVVDIMLAMKEHNRYIPGLRSYAGFTQTGIEIERAERYQGDPRVSLRQLFKLAMDGIFSMSHLPLKLATYAGIIIAIPAFVLAAIVVCIKLFTDNASPGWASNLASTFFMGGIQLIFLGIIGEYLSRIYDEVKGRPYFIVSEQTGFNHLNRTDDRCDDE